MADGTPCEVIRTDDTTKNLLVQVRVGKEKKRGWVKPDLFSVQPDLNVDDEALRNARVALCTGIRLVMAHGLALLGVSAPEEM